MILRDLTLIGTVRNHVYSFKVEKKLFYYHNTMVLILEYGGNIV